MKNNKIVSTIYILVAVFLIINGFVGCELAKNNIILIRESPDKKYNAVVFDRDAGSTTRISYHLSILEAGDKFENLVGNIYITYTEFEVTWIDEYTLYVTNIDVNPDSIFKQVREFGEVSIVYDN